MNPKKTLMAAIAGLALAAPIACQRDNVERTVSEEIATAAGTGGDSGTPRIEDDQDDPAGIDDETETATGAIEQNDMDDPTRGEVPRE